MCDQQRLRPACAYAQSGKSLCLSLKYSSTFNLLTEVHLEFPSLTGGYTGSFESTLFKMPHCWKSHVPAHFIIQPAHEMLVLIPCRATKTLHKYTKYGCR